MRNRHERIDYLKIARQLRHNMTPTERLLWERLRARRLVGFKFLRQHVVREAIADFYCHELRLIVEVDGAAHENTLEQERDDERDFQLAAHGYRTLRIRDTEIIINIDAVCTQILNTVYAEIRYLQNASSQI